MASPVYMDCRKLLSYPRIRSAIMDFAAATITRGAGLERFDAIAGGETAGIPFAALLADRLALPMIYVRKKPKGHGRNAQIEGVMPEGARVLVIEDLVTVGGSMFTFIDAIRAAGGIVDHGMSLFYYGIFKEAEARAMRMAASGSIMSPPGATCSPWRAGTGSSTRRRSPRSNPSSTRRSPGRPPMAASRRCRPREMRSGAFRGNRLNRLKDQRGECS